MKSVMERLIEKIRAARIDPNPSENFYMEDIFDPAVYNELLSRLPSDDHYELIEHPDAVLPDGTITRQLLDLTDKTIALFNPQDQSFWREMKTILTSDTLQKMILQKFYPRIKERFGERWPEMVTVPIFYRDLPGYRIGIHTDAPYKVATMQLYLPKDNSQLHLGTSFHQKQGTQFQLLKTNVFKPNSAYAFVRTDQSWHSVKQLGPQESVRNTLALTIYEKGSEYHSTKSYR